MLCLRDYVNTDEHILLGFVKDERDFRLWTADRYGKYPLKGGEINANYKKCAENCFFKPFMVEENGTPIGHFILRNPTADPRVFRIGFVLVDKNLRGKGYGQKIIQLAVRYAYDKLNATQVNLGVFINNKCAVECYKKVGFELVLNSFDNLEDANEVHFYDFYGEQWEYAKMVYRP